MLGAGNPVMPTVVWVPVLTQLAVQGSTGQGSAVTGGFIQPDEQPGGLPEEVTSKKRPE